MEQGFGDDPAAARESSGQKSDTENSRKDQQAGKQGIHGNPSTVVASQPGIQLRNPSRVAI